MKSKEKPNLTVKCKDCKEIMTFHMHECARGYQEYFGCTKCDNWCSTCRKDWNPAEKIKKKSKKK